jgi:hypothetical protein
MWHARVRGEVFTGVWFGRYEGKSPLARRRRRWEEELGIDGANWIRLAQWWAFVRTIINLRVP